MLVDLNLLFHGCKTTSDSLREVALFGELLRLVNPNRWVGRNWSANVRLLRLRECVTVCNGAQRSLSMNQTFNNLVHW